MKEADIAIDEVIGEPEVLMHRTQLPRLVCEQIEAAYRRMASEARYRPTAPSDGMGNITVPQEELNLDLEAFEYAGRWWAEEDNSDFYIGCCNFPTRVATIFAIEAARLMCSGVMDKAALKLLEMAALELKRVGKLVRDESSNGNKRKQVGDSLRYRIMRRDRFCCVLCGATGKGAILVLDHIIPVSKGGATTAQNLRTLCETCNRGKGAMLEFVPEGVGDA